MGMLSYLVGGAVRDKLLGRPPGDRDFVVVGSSPEEMTAAGFKPVGGEFPVFLHPTTGEEYALARTEKKEGRGYRGFVFHAAPDVCLEDDLRRRDLTVNAMAEDDSGKLIDPFGGAADIKKKVLRHVSDAFVEDPVRALRTARFAAALPDFSVASETMALLQAMVQNGETEHLIRERVWRELSLGFAAARPRRMIETMHQCGLLAQILPEVAALDGTPERLDYHPEGDSFVHTMMTLDAAAELKLSAAEVFATLLHDIGKAQTPKDILPSHHGHEARGAKLAEALCARLSPPREFSELAILATAEHGNVHNALNARPGTVADLLSRLGEDSDLAALTAAEHGNVHNALNAPATTVADLLSRLDAHRRPTRAESVLRVCEADYAYWPARRGTEYPQGIFLREAMGAAAKVDSGDIARAVVEKHGDRPQKIAEQIRQRRILEVRKIRRLSHHESAWRKMQEVQGSSAMAFIKLFDEAIQLSEKEEWSAAIAKWDEVIPLLSDNEARAPAFNIRGIAKSRMDDYAGAVADYDQALEIDPQYAEAYGNRGVAKSQMGKHMSAITDYDRSLELNPQYAAVYNNRGNAKSGMGDYKGALADFAKILEINPLDATAYFNRGIVKGQMGNHAGAVADYDQALKIDPQYADAYSNRGNAKSRMGDYAGAIADFDNALQIDPQNAVTLNSRGNAKSDMGDYAGAIADYNQAMKIDPQYADPHYNRGTVKSDMGDYADAIADYDRALEVNPQYAEAYYNRGTIKSDMGGYADAIADFDKALEVNPQYAEAYYNRGIAKERKGDHEGAIPDYDQALKINPKLAEAYINRGNAKSSD